MKTKTRILDTALNLFNEQGAHSITTNHIARTAGISPGNLYYHYKNKEEIIRSLFRSISDEFDVLWKVRDEKVSAVTALYTLLEDICRLYYRYRFFYLEIVTLLAEDPLLMKEYVDTRKKRFSQQSLFSEIMSSEGALKGYTPEDFESLLSGLWIISDFWLSHLFISHIKITPSSIRKLIPHIYAMLKPHLSEQAQEEFNYLMKKNR